MSFEIAIKVENLSKCYHIYDQPRDRLKQIIVPRMQRVVGVQPKQYFREFWALKDVSFEVKKGETVGIIGPNGSGKSTLLQMICGTLNPTCGSIQAHGRIAALLELGSGFNPEFTGSENVYLNGAVLGLSKEEIDARFDEIAAFADIGNFIECPVKTYSSGMMVRLAFAVAVNVDPDILIVDEALSVGDELFQRKCFSRIEAIRAGGATILFVSHSGTQVTELCDRVILIDSGEKIYVGEPKYAVSAYQRLLYAPPNKRKELKSEIILESSEVPALVGMLDNSKIAPKKESFSYGQEETYDPNLVPSSTIEFESHGPLIDVPRILAFDGQQVNGLIRGKKYRYCYRVDFRREAASVRFGMSVKSTTGLSLAGALSAPDLNRSVKKIDAGSMVDVEFIFECHLNPGVYFMSAGVFGLENGNELVLHRRAEILAFRVLPVSENIETEVMSLAFKSSVYINEKIV